MPLTENEYNFLRWYRSLTGAQKIAVRAYLKHGDERLLSWFAECRKVLYGFVGTALPERQNELTLLLS